MTTKHLKKVSEFPHEYPPSKIMWEPTQGGQLLATSSDRVKLWIVPEEQPPQLLMDLAQNSMDTNKANNPYFAPVTSFDWSPIQTNILATA